MLFDEKIGFSYVKKNRKNSTVDIFFFFSATVILYNNITVANYKIQNEQI